MNARWTAFVLILVGVLLICVSGAGALTPTSVNGTSDERLSGTRTSEMLAGGSGDDSIFGAAGDDDLSGGAGADELYGGNGRDVLLGGSGADFLEAKDGHKDYVDCGTGPGDVASIDNLDRVSSSCEIVYRG